MDGITKKMVAEAYDETLSEALARGESSETAHKEGLTAAAMFLSSISGLEDAVALAEVATLGLKPD